MIFEFDWSGGFFVARSKGLESGLAEAVNHPNLTFAVSPKYSSNETKIYIFISRIPRVVYRIFLGLFKILFLPPLVDIYRHPLLNSLTRAIVKEGKIIWPQHTEIEVNVYLLPNSFSVLSHFQVFLRAEMHLLIFLAVVLFGPPRATQGKGRTIRKVMGGGRSTKKKFMHGKIKWKKFMHVE